MAIVFETKQDNIVSGATGITINKPTGVANGDVLVATISQSTQLTETLTKPDGWVVVIEDAYDYEYVTCHVFYKVITNSAGEPSSYTWSGGSADWAGGIARYSGVSNTNPSDVSPSSNTGNASPATALGITTITDNAMLVWAISQKNVSSFTPPSGFSERYDRYVNSTLNEMADIAQATKGASGNKTATCSAQSWVAILWALRPAGGGATARGNHYARLRRV